MFGIISHFFDRLFSSSTASLAPAVGRSLKESYQCDAISSMTQLNSSHFSRMHTFRLEVGPNQPKSAL
jgi:hypothetical protein